MREGGGSVASDSLSLSVPVSSSWSVDASSAASSSCRRTIDSAPDSLTAAGSAGRSCHRTSKPSTTNSTRAFAAPTLGPTTKIICALAREADSFAVEWRLLSVLQGCAYACDNAENVVFKCEVKVSSAASSSTRFLTLRESVFALGIRESWTTGLQGLFRKCGERDTMWCTYNGI